MTTDQIPQSRKQAQALLVQQLWARGRAAAVAHDDVSLMTALLLCDLAVETMLKLVIPGSERKDSPTLLKAAADRWPELFIRSVIEPFGHLRTIRNTVQHECSSPSRPSVLRALGDGENSLRRAFPILFNHEFGELSYQSLLSDEVLARRLEHARQAIDGGDLVRGGVLLGACFQQMRLRWSDQFSRARVRRETRRCLPVKLYTLTSCAFALPDGSLAPGVISHELDLADSSNVIASYGGIGFSVHDLADMRELENAGTKSVNGAKNGVLSAEPLSQYTIDALKGLYEKTAYRLWCLEQSEPQIFGRDAVLAGQ